VNKFWRKSLLSSAPALPERPILPWSSLTLEQWRLSEIRVNFAAKLLASNLGRDMLAVLQNTMPPPDISDASRAAIEAGRVRGYMQAIATLMQMQVPTIGVKDLPEPTYETSTEDMILNETG